MGTRWEEEYVKRLRDLCNLKTATILNVARRPEVTPLISPPYYPRYNGAIEAGIGSLKTRTQAHASCHGHPAYRTCDDVAAAQDDANHNARPRGPSGPS